MDTSHDARNPSADIESKTSAMDTEVLGQSEGTPAGIRSSPPPLPTGTGVDNENESQPGDKSDSEAETVVLQGVNGQSPSKGRKKIKLEDKTNESSALNDVEESGKAVADADAQGAHDVGESVTSSLGKRKRSKPTTRLDNNHTGNSSGLSSVPTSPVTTTRSSLSKPADSESDVSKSPSPRLTRREKLQSSEKILAKVENQNGDSDHEREQRRSRRKLSNGFEGRGQARQNKAGQSSSHDPRTRSTSPQLGHRRSTSRQLSASNATTNGLSQKKRKIPAPLRSTRDRHSADNRSDDDSSTGESSRPRRSRTRALATPPTGNSSASAVKMVHKKKINHIGQTPFYVACNDGDLGKAKQLLAESPEDLNRADNDENTPLQAASLNGHEDIVEFLIDAGCNIHCYNHRKDTPLLDAVENSHLGVVKLLLDAGVNPRIRNVGGEEPIDKIDEDDEDAADIRDALQTARAKFSHAPPPVPTPTPPVPEPTSARSQRTQSHGRSTKTGEHRLFTPFNVTSIRSAAASGDVGTVCFVLDTKWPNGGFDDPESLVAAAKGGHVDALSILIGLGGADPDPLPVDHLPADQATPILAAIGGENIKVIELLVEQSEGGRFDPTKRHNGKTYYEIAKDRAGPNWTEEERILKQAYLERKNSHGNRTSPLSRKTQSGSQGHQRKSSDERSSSTKSRRLSLGSSQGSKRDEKVTPTPGKRGPGRPRKDGSEVLGPNEHDTSFATSTKQESRRKEDTEENTEVAKPKRKLVSGKDLKGERERHRRASFASVASTTSAADAEISTKMTIPHRSNSSRIRGSSSDRDHASDRSPELYRSGKASDKKLSDTRGESPTKRARSSLTPPVESPEASSAKPGDRSALKKRRRLKNEDSPTMVQTTLPKVENPPSELTSRRPSDEGSRKSEERSASDAKPESENQDAGSSTEGQKLAAEKEKAVREEENEIALRAQADKEAKAAREKAEREAALAKENEAKLEKQRVEAARLAKEAEEKRLHEEVLQREREREEAERRERQRREEAEAQRRAEEERRRRYEEQQRLQREEMERRRAAHLAEQRAERLRQQQAQEAARLAKLPPLLRWFHQHPQPATPEFAEYFTKLWGYRYDTIKPEATGQPDGRELWLVNIQVALLLGEKDLQLSRYTAWDRLPVSPVAKENLWWVTRSLFCMFDTLSHFNPEYPVQDPLGPKKHIPLAKQFRLEHEGKTLYNSMPVELFFVKLSDFLYIVPKFPHLRNLQLVVGYREVPQGPEKTMNKFKQDRDRGGNEGYCPTDKHYVNGLFTGEGRKAGRSKVSKTPFPIPPKRYPMVGLFEVLPGEPDFEKLCREQGLEHLLEDTSATDGVSSGPGEQQPQNELGKSGAGESHLQNGTAGVTPPESNASADAEMHDLPSSIVNGNAVPAEGPGSHSAAP